MCLLTTNCVPTNKYLEFVRPIHDSSSRIRRAHKNRAERATNTPDASWGLYQDMERNTPSQEITSGSFPEKAQPKHENRPTWVTSTQTPAVVDLREDDDKVVTKSVADLTPADGGMLVIEDWHGREALVPEWRWVEVRYLELCKADGHLAVHPNDWRLLPDDVQETFDAPTDELNDEELVTDGGQEVRYSGGITPPRYTSFSQRERIDELVATMADQDDSIDRTDVIEQALDLLEAEIEPEAVTDGGMTMERREDRETAAVLANHRQADALEVIAGMLMLDYLDHEDRPDYSVESLHREAVFHARGGKP